MTTAVYHTSVSDEWHTPADLAAAARAFLGAIDLDPASCAEANTIIRATTYYDLEHDGLMQHWEGRVWMNPPYSRVGDWVAKLVMHYQTHDISEALLLVPARVDTRWWQVVSPFLVCFIRGRLRFSGAPASAPFPSALLYLGDDGLRFKDAFRTWGQIYVPIMQGVL